MFYLAAGLLTSVISNNASVVSMIPVAVSAARSIGANAFAFVLAVTFAASTSKFLEVPPSSISDVPTGVIGLGRVGAKSSKPEPVWWEEIHSDGNYPYLVHFSEIYWFGNVDEPEDALVSEKDTEEMVHDIRHIAKDIITFNEMREDAGYQIPPQGSPQISNTQRSYSH